jgi:hypothetical protein
MCVREIETKDSKPNAPAILAKAKAMPEASNYKITDRNIGKVLDILVNIGRLERRSDGTYSLTKAGSLWLQGLDFLRGAREAIADVR